MIWKYRKACNKKAQKFFDRRVAQGVWSYDLDKCCITFRGKGLYYKLFLQGDIMTSQFHPRLALLMIKKFSLVEKNRIHYNFFYYDLKISPDNILEHISYSLQ